MEGSLRASRINLILLDPSANPKQVTGKNSKIILDFVESALIKASSSMKIKVTELKFKCIL